jgi:hypothetical protein
MPTHAFGIRVTSNAKLVAKSLQDLGAEIPKVGRQQIYNVALRSRTILRKPGKKSKRPVPWDSIRQKIKVLIILRYVLKEMPYRRRGIYNKAFNIVKQPNGYDIINEQERATYISGDADGKGQSKIFRGRYPIMRNVIDQEMDKLPTAVVAHIELVAQKKGLGSGGPTT